MHIQKGDEGVGGVSCVSKFIPVIIDKLRNSTQSSYRSIKVVHEDIICLVVDNSGGNGTNEVMLEYNEYMVSNYNISALHQVPWSPKTNMLSFGA